MAALMFFQCTAPVAFAADDAILAESSIAVSSADSESVPADSDAGYIPEQSPENTSVDSSSMNEASSEPLTGDSSASSDLPEDASSNSSVESQPESDTDQISTSDETIDSELAESSSENTDESAKSLYQDGKILIYTYNQLAEIGSGQTLTDASGLAVTDENGAEITYALDAQYAIAEDIELTGDMLQWQLPEGFTGSITPLTENSDDLTLYDAQSDTIYLYNPYQLSVLQAEDPAKEPVLDGDAHADSFGMGQLIYPKGEDAPYLTYSLTHHYVISTQFSSEITDAPISVLDDSPAGSTDGRDFAGQVVKTIGDKTYILIGNEQQLRKIGSGDTVYGAVYQAIHHNAKWTIDHDSSGNLIMLYGGDADLTKEQNGTDNYTLGKDGIHAADKNLSDKASNILYVYTVGRCGVNQTTGKIDPNLDIDKAANQTYASNANYIIFRDIDLSSANWTPLTFQGTMIGAKSANGEKIWNDDSSAINTSTKPTISNVSVMQTGKLNVGKQMGVGFFSTISSEVSENDIGLSKGLVQVSNLKFQNISVQTTTSETYYPETLVSELTSTLGKLLGGVLSGLTFILTFGQVKIDLGKTLGDVLDARKKDPTALATGAIAGRVEGQVLFSGIEVVNADVKNVNNNTGGFVGYTVGVTEYDGLSNALGGLVKLLSNILNVIPGLGLGDLITILLGNAIPLDKLIPTGYINAKFVDCSIDGLNISTSNEKDYAGGFVGQQSGSIIETCTVKNSNLSLQGKNFVGGFVGLARDSIIKGTLSGALDIETKLPKMNTESLLLGCSLSDTSVTVNSVNYAGGFAGGLANTAAVNCSATGSFAVSATESNAGGFAGIGIVNLDVVFAKAHCIRRNGIPKILSQSGAVVKIKLEVRFLSDAEKVVQHFQPGVVIQRTDFAANVGQLAQHIPLHLIQPFAGILAVLLVGGENQVLLLLHIADFFRIGFHQTIAFDAVCVETIIGAVVQNISLKGNLVHALADNAKLRPAVGRNIRINPAHLCQNVLLFIVALHGIVDVGDTPHLAVHLAGAPSAVRIDFINRDRFLHRSRDFVAAPRSACGGIFI